MAVTDKHPGLKVEVVVDGAPLKEYNDDDSNDQEIVSKYIEAQSGAEFAVRSTFTAPFPRGHGVQIAVRVDGTTRRYGYESTDLYGRRGHTCTGISYQQDGIWYEQKYCFATLNIAEEVDRPANIVELRKDVWATGSIEVSFKYVTNIRRVPVAADSYRKQLEELRPLGAIPEKALKGDARSHQIILSAPQKRREGTYSLNYDFVSEKPFAVFVYKYRSLAALKALRVIIEDENEPARLEGRPRYELASEVQRTSQQQANDGNIKKEKKSSVIKSERIRDDETFEDDELTILETRSVKRRRLDAEVIVLD